jgi:hypothetical protein
MDIPSSIYAVLKLHFYLCCLPHGSDLTLFSFVMDAKETITDDAFCPSLSSDLLQFRKHESPGPYLTILSNP